MLWLITCALILGVVFLLNILYKRQRDKLSYWEKLGVTTLPSHNVLFGDLTSCVLGKLNFYDLIDKLYYKFKEKGEKYVGIYLSTIPVLLLTDSELIKNVLIKDFEYFADRVTVNIDTKKEPLNGHLFFAKYHKWKVSRNKFSPMFTSNKLKMMYPILVKHTNTLIEVIRQSGYKDVEFKSTFERMGIDIIGQIAFGLDCNTQQHQNEDFYKMAMKVFNFKPKEAIKMFLFDCSAPVDLVRLTGCDQELTTYFSNLIKNTIKYREENNVQAYDLLQVMIQMVRDDPDISVENILPEAFVFFIGAFETFTGAMLYSLYELSKHTDLQQRVRNEIMQQDDLTYDFVVNNKLLDLIIKEALRKHTIVPQIYRVCTKDYKLDSGITLKAGTNVLVSTISVHKDPHNFKNPDVFDPFRNDEDTRLYLPFGEGPRYCIGRPFGLMQIKLALMEMLKNFEFTTTTPDKLDLSVSSTSPTIQYKQKLLFNIKPLS